MYVRRESFDNDAGLMECFHKIHVLTSMVKALQKLKRSVMLKVKALV